MHFALFILLFTALGSSIQAIVYTLENEADSFKVVLEIAWAASLFYAASQVWQHM